MKKYTLLIVFGVFAPLCGMQSPGTRYGTYNPGRDVADFLEKNVDNYECIAWALLRGAAVNVAPGDRLIEKAVYQENLPSVIALLLGGANPNIIGCKAGGYGGYRLREVSYALKPHSSDAGLIWQVLRNFVRTDDLYRTVEQYKKLGVPEIEAALLVMKTQRVISVFERLKNEGDFFFFKNHTYYFVPRQLGDLQATGLLECEPFRYVTDE